MPLHVTPAQARALLDGGRAAGSRPKKTRARSKRAPASETAPNRCATCGEFTKGETDEVRHMDATGHHRYEMIL